MPRGLPSVYVIQPTKEMMLRAKKINRAMKTRRRFAFHKEKIRYVITRGIVDTQGDHSTRELIVNNEFKCGEYSWKKKNADHFRMPVMVSRN